MMKPCLIAALAAATLLPAPAAAALQVGARAPTFSTQAAVAGKPMPFALAQALKKGPVVLYFFPKPFTKGCTVEAHAFSDASGDFAKMGATVIGLSADKLEGDKGLRQFSTLECRDRFAVGVATPRIIADYDVKLKDTGLSDRTSYVIAPDGKVIYAYSAMDPAGHVEGTMKAVRDWKAAHGG